MKQKLRVPEKELNAAADAARERVSAYSPEKRVKLSAQARAITAKGRQRLPNSY